MRIWFNYLATEARNKFSLKLCLREENERNKLRSERKIILRECHGKFFFFLLVMRKIAKRFQFLRTHSAINNASRNIRKSSSFKKSFTLDKAREQKRFVNVNYLWAAQKGFYFYRSVARILTEIARFNSLPSFRFDNYTQSVIFHPGFLGYCSRVKFICSVLA